MLRVERLVQHKMVESSGESVVPFAGSLLSKILAILAGYGGSLWIGDLPYVFTAAAGTGVASESSAVAYAKDYCGAYNATQSTAGKCPLVKLASAKWGFKFDGADDVLLTGNLPSVAAETFGAVYTAPASASAAQYPLSRRNAGASTGSALYINNTNFSVNFINGTGAVATGSSIAAGTSGVVSAVGKVGSVSVKVNGVDGAAVTYTSYAATTNPLALGNSTDSQRAFSGTLHAAYYAPKEISSADRQAIDRLLGLLYGISVA